MSFRSHKSKHDVNDMHKQVLDRFYAQASEGTTSFDSKVDVMHICKYWIYTMYTRVQAQHYAQVIVSSLDTMHMSK